MKMRRYRRVKDLYKLQKLVKKGGFGVHSIHELGRENELLAQAKQLHAAVYLKRNFVNTNDIDENGSLKTESDPHQHHAHYFIARTPGHGNNEVVAVVRQIESDPSKGFESFPVLEKAHIFSRSLVEITSHDPNTCIEVSALSKKSGIGTEAMLLLYREMWYRSLRDGHTVWLMACDVRLYERLKLLFDDALKRIGSRTSYQGGDVIPAMLRPFDALNALIASTESSKLSVKRFRKNLLRFLCEGYPDELLDPLQTKKLAKLGALPKNVK